MPINVAEAREDLEKLNNPSWGGGMNILYNDGYFARSLVQKYQMSLTELAIYVRKNGGSATDIKLDNAVKAAMKLANRGNVKHAEMRRALKPFVKS